MSTIENLPEEKVAPPQPINRLGQFKISGGLLRAHWPGLLPLFAHMVILRCEFIMVSDVAEYMAQSDLFEESPAHCVPPEYEIIATKQEDGPVEYTAKKILSLADIKLK